MLFGMKCELIYNGCGKRPLDLSDVWWHIDQMKDWLSLDASNRMILKVWKLGRNFC